MIGQKDTGDPGARSTGFVSLVGAGPGDPDLLTQRAVRRLAEADLVLYDALVSPEVLPLASRAQCLSVGKRACRPSISQEAINRCLVRGARRGKRVVRLKCGDPFVFGRGGEEAIALAAAGVPFEIVPGVSSALAAPALAGIPVTHRGRVFQRDRRVRPFTLGVRADRRCGDAAFDDDRRADGTRLADASRAAPAAAWMGGADARRRAALGRRLPPRARGLARSAS